MLRKEYLFDKGQPLIKIRASFVPDSKHLTLLTVLLKVKIIVLYFVNHFLRKLPPSQAFSYYVKQSKTNSLCKNCAIL